MVPKAAMLAVTLLVACNDAANVALPALEYRLARANGLAIPAEVERLSLGSNTQVSRVVAGGLSLARSDSAQFMLHTETVVYDPAGTPLASEAACHNVLVAQRVSGGRLYLDLEYVAPPSQGAFAVRMHDTLTISGSQLIGNHKVVFGTTSTTGKVILLEYSAAANPVPPC